MAEFKVFIVCVVLSFVGTISISDAQETDSLIQHLGHTDMSYRLRAINQLTNLGESVMPELIKALAHENYMVRVNAAYVLGLLEGRAQNAIPALTKALIDDSALVRESAAEALREIGTSGAMKALGEYKEMQEPTQSRSRWTAFGIGMAGGVLGGGLIGGAIGSGTRCLDEDGVEGDCIIEGVILGAVIGGIVGGIFGFRLGGNRNKNTVQHGRIRNYEKLLPSPAKSERGFYTQLLEIQF